MNNVPKLIGVAILVAATGCGVTFRAATPAGFVEMDDQTSYDYRAIAPEGVAIGVRAIDINDKGDLGFWTRAVTLRMRQLNGYAVVSERDVKSLDGTAGHEVVFGHDEGGKPFVYQVRLFVAQNRLFIVEAGGPQTVYAQHKVAVNGALDRMKVRCSMFLSPVFASRTCGRW